MVRYLAATTIRCCLRRENHQRPMLKLVRRHVGSECFPVVSLFALMCGASAAHV